MTRAKITVSIPEELVRSADRLAEQEDRSRSWVVAEAVARYVGRVGKGERSGERAAEKTGGDRGLGPSRSHQLAADLALTPERRVLEAELTARLALLRERRGNRSFVMSFERYEDYLARKERERAGLE